jgi:hypothetical protein
MISDQELISAIVTVEQNIKDLDVQREKSKNDSGQVKVWAQNMSALKIKLQILHYCQGLTGMISAEELSQALEKTKTFYADLSAPREQDLFAPSEDKTLPQKIFAMQTKIFALQFVAGVEKRII